jgi:hypothetical protein
LALFFVLVIIVVILSPDVVTALAIIGLLIGLTTACDSMAGGGDSGGDSGGSGDSGGCRCCGGPPVSEERFHSAPAHGGYPGAIDVDEYDTEPALGHRDRAENDNESAPDGNPYNLGRVGAPHAAAACIDDEANNDEIDGDERASYQARSRNDPTRATAGAMNRRRDLDEYLREEVEKEEDRVWWGRHEY